MRILIAAGLWFPDVLGGVPRVVADTARLLAHRGHEVTVIARRFEGTPRRETSGALTVVRILPSPSLPIATATDVAFMASAARQLGGSWDVALAHSSTTLLGLASARISAPLVRVYHASAVRELRFVREHLSPGPERWRKYALEPLLSAADTVSLKASRRVFVLSEFSRGLIASDHPSALRHTVNVGGGVDTDRFSPGDGPQAARTRLGIDLKARLVLTVRRLDYRMGLDLLLEAMTAPPIPSTMLAIVGSGRLADQLKRLTDDLGIRDRVWFLGAVRDEELIDWYRAADVFVIPTVAYEGFGMVTAEALASGTPVIGTPIGATPEILRPLSPRLVTSGAKSEDIANTIAEVLNHTGPTMRERVRCHALARLAWTKTIRKWESELKTVARSE